MKKILLAVTVALAITSCSQNEEFENEGQKTEINFTTIVSKATRASELKTEGLKTNGGFKVFAYNTKNNDMSAETILGETPFMNGVIVSWNSSAWTMNPVGPYYWPLKDKIQFFSYSPVANVSYVEPTSSKAGYPSFSYTIVDSQEDLVVAYAKNETKPGVSGTPVKLDFKHVLTQINFKLKGKDEVTLDRTHIPLSLFPGDTLLLCSDGISDPLTLKQIREAMELPVQDCCSALETAIRKAALPTQDNYTAIVLHYYGEKENTE